jgi:acetylornithine deacetylase
MSLDVTLQQRLADLVAFDTQNPTGDESRLINQLATDLRAVGATEVETFRVGSHHAVLARFGEAPRVLLNAHVDTVPANRGYTAPPLTLVERGGRLYGLGSADTKGAIAAILDALRIRAAAGRPATGVSVLFSGDEERGNTVLREVLAGGRLRGLERAIVCEPTGCRVGARHRGIASARATATSPGGHSSRADALPAPIVTLARVAVALDVWGKENRDAGPPGFRGLCLNVAGIDGGVAFNVVPSLGVLTFSFRPWPGADVADLHRQAEARARAAATPDELGWEITIASPPFAARDAAAFAPWLGDAVQAPVDLQFWTEAALFSAAGIDAVVFGPGDIAQAHAPDEYVEMAQLTLARDTFLRALP